MSSTTSVVVVERGQDFSLAFDVASPDGHAVDLSGYSLAGSLTRDGSAIASLACSLSGTSRVEAALDAASTAALAPGQCRY